MTNTSSLMIKIAKVALVTGAIVITLVALAVYATTFRKVGSSSESSRWQGSIATSTGGMGMMDVATLPIVATENMDVSSSARQTTSTSRVIKTGSVDMTSENVSETVTAISSLSEAKGGYVQSSSTNNDEIDRTFSYVTIRVPVSTFEETMSEIKTFGAHINSESVSGEDVTEQYTDINARLTAAKAQEAQYLIILESAETVGEVLAVEEHLASVRADIESFQGQINYLESRTDLATISVTISEETTATTGTNGKFDPIRDANSALALVILLGQHALSAAIWILIVGAAIGIPVAMIFGMYWLVARRRALDTKRRR